MAVITPNYTDSGTSLSGLAGATVAVGANARALLDLRLKIGAYVEIAIGRLGTTPPAANVDVVLRPTINGDARRFPAAPVRQHQLSTPTSIAINANSSIGDTTLTTATNWTGIVSNDLVLIGGNAGSPSNPEFARVSKIATVTMTLDAPLKKAHTSADTVVNKADCFARIWVPGGQEMEIIVDYGGSGTGSSLYVDAYAVTYDSDTIA